MPIVLSNKKAILCFANFIFIISLLRVKGESKIMLKDSSVIRNNYVKILKG